MNDIPAIEITAVSKAYPGAERPAVDDVTLAVPQGQIFGLLGPNGAGKTTLLSMVSGLLRPDAGTLHIGGFAAGSAQAKQSLGLVPQELAIYPSLTPRENLSFFGQMHGLRGKLLKERVEECLRLAGLEEFADRRAAMFSGGLKRRLNLVIGLIHSPSLLILDEPTVGIDPQSRHFIHETLRRLNGMGMTIVYTTHYMEEVESLCTALAIIDRGRVIAQGTLDALLNRYQQGGIELRLREPLSAGVEQQFLAEFKAAIAGDRIAIQGEAPQRTLRELIAFFDSSGVEIVSVSMGAINLEQVFLILTGTRLRD